MTLSRQQRHLLLWALLGLPVVGLGLLETYGGTDDETDYRAYESVLKIRPDSHKTHFMLSQAYAEQGKKDLALEHAQAARDLRPSYDVYDVQYVDLLMDDLSTLSQQQLEEIAVAYENAARTRPDLPNIFDNWGIVLQKLDRLAEAEDVLNRATRADPNNAEVRYHLAQVYAQQQKYQQAADACVAATKSDPAHLESHSMAATLLMQLGTPDLAIPYFDRAVRIDPTNVGNKVNYAMALATSPPPVRDLSTAMKLADDVISASEQLTAGTVISLMQIYVACGNVERAITLGDSASKQFAQQNVAGAQQVASLVEELRKQN